MNVNELISNVSKLKRNTGTIFDNGYDSAIAMCLYQIKEYEKSVIQSSGSEEKVDHPSHYKRSGAMECIDEMVITFGAEATINFCLCNAWKYRYRAGMKGDAEEDLKKSDWYIQKAKQLQFKSDDA